MAALKTVYTCPAFRVIENHVNCVSRAINIVPGAEFAIAYESRNHGKMYNRYTAGSVVASSISRAACPFAAVERAKTLGHEMHWLNQQETSITAHKREQETFIELKDGDFVCFEGLYFNIKMDREFVKLVPAAAPEGLVE